MIACLYKYREETSVVGREIQAVIDFFSRLDGERCSQVVMKWRVLECRPDYPHRTERRVRGCGLCE